MDIVRRTLLGAAAGLAAHPLTTAFAQGDWPARPIRMVSPYGAGGASDISARIIGEHLSRTLGQSVLVENKPGAGTRVANEGVARAAPDGYTVLYAAAPYATAEALHGKLSYDPRKDLLPIAKACIAPIFLIVNAEAPYKTLPEFIAYGKSLAQGLTFGSPGSGSQPHLAGELLMRDAGVKGISVHFRGDAMAYTELLAGRIDATLTAISTALPHIRAGKLRVLGVASARRSEIYPDAAPLHEQGLPNVVASGWYGFMVPAGTPAPIVGRLHGAIAAALGDGEVRKKLQNAGLEVDTGSAEAFGRFIEAESRKWGEVIRKAGITGG